MFSRVLRVALPVAVMVSLTAVGGVSRAATTPGWRVTGILSNGQTFTSFNDLEAEGRGNAWLPWSSCQGSSCTLIVRHWNGRSWRTVAVPKAFVNSPTFAGGTAPAAFGSHLWVFAGVGAASQSTSGTAVLRWTGKGWAAHPATLDAAIFTAVAPSATDVWAFGANGREPYAAHFNGTKLTQMSVPILADRMSASSPSNVWVIGQPVVQTAKTTIFAVIMRFNGHKWITTPLPHFSLRPQQIVQEQGIVAVSPTDVWATGTLLVPASSMVGTPDQTPFLLHWDGRKWSRIKVPYSDPFAPADGGIARDGHGGVWLGVGDTDSGIGAMLHYNHGHWSRFPVPATKGDTDLPDNLDWIPGTQSVWGIGSETFLAPPVNFDTVLLKYGP